MNKLILLASVCLTSIMSLKAQSLKGVLQDVSDQSPFPVATVILKDSLTKALSSVTHKQGSFTFQKIPMGKYTLSFSSVGYDAYENIISVTDTGNIDLGIISIAKSSKILSTVVVNATAPPVKQKADTLEYAANGFKVNPDANAEDLLKKMPGVTVDKGTVTAQGETVKKVTVDGKEFFGDDATGKKFLKAQAGELELSVFDLLKQNRSISRNVTESYIEDVQNQVL